MVCIDQQRYFIVVSFTVSNGALVAEEGAGIPSSEIAIGHTGWAALCMYLRVFILLKTLNFKAV